MLRMEHAQDQEMLFFPWMERVYMTGLQRGPPTLCNKNKTFCTHAQKMLFFPVDGAGSRRGLGTLCCKK
jgi:hypothetical protein